MTGRARTPDEIRATIRQRSIVDDNECWNFRTQVEAENAAIELRRKLFTHSDADNTARQAARS